MRTIALPSGASLATPATKTTTKPSTTTRRPPVFMPQNDLFNINVFKKTLLTDFDAKPANDEAPSPAVNTKHPLSPGAVASLSTSLKNEESTLGTVNLPSGVSLAEGDSTLDQNYVQNPSGEGLLKPVTGVAKPADSTGSTLDHFDGPSELENDPPSMLVPMLVVGGVVLLVVMMKK